MAAVTAFTIAAMALSAAATAVSYKGQRDAAKTQERISEYNAKTRENQAITQDLEAREAISRERKRGKALLARQRAAYAGAGVTSAGSPLEVLGETKSNIELEAAEMAREAESRRRVGFGEAAAERYTGRAKASAYRSQATGTLLSGAADMFRMGASL